MTGHPELINATFIWISDYALTSHI